MGGHAQGRPGPWQGSAPDPQTSPDLLMFPVCADLQFSARRADTPGTCGTAGSGKACTLARDDGAVRMQAPQDRKRADAGLGLPVPDRARGPGQAIGIL